MILPVLERKCLPCRRALALFSLAWIYFTPVHAQTMDAIKQTVRKRFPTVRELSTAELAEWLERPDSERPLLIDARTPEEFAISHLPGATNLTSPEAIQAARRARGSNAVVLYCAVGYRSASLADKLQRRGESAVYNLGGSIFQWANERKPLYRGTNRVTEVHPFSRKWGKLLDEDLHARQQKRAK